MDLMHRYFRADLQQVRLGPLSLVDRTDPLHQSHQALTDHLALWDLYLRAALWHQSLRSHQSVLSCLALLTDRWDLLRQLDQYSLQILSVQTDQCLQVGQRDL